MTHLNGSTWAAFRTHLHRGGAFAYWWTLDETQTYQITRGPRAGQQEKCKRTIWWPVDKPLPLPNGTTEHVYFGVHPVVAIPQARTNKKTGEIYTPKPEFTRAEIADIAAINCLFGEFDAKDFAGEKAGALEHINRLPLKPTALIDSGGGYHAYWLLIDSVIITDDNRASIKDLQNRWVQFVDSDDDSKDLARVLRVPGRRNVKAKYGPDFPAVAFVYADFDRLYTLDQLAATIPPDITAVEARESVPFTSTPGDHSAYVQKAYEGERAAVLGALDGTKHHTLRNAASKLAGLIWTNQISEQQIADGLQDAAERNRCDIGYAHRTIADGIAYGKDRPREIPERQSQPADDAHRSHGVQGTALDRAFILECLSMGEAGDAKLTQATYAGQLVYDHDAGTWYTFEGHTWAHYSGTPHRAIWGRVAAIYLALAAQIQAQAGADKEAVLKTVDALTKRAGQLRALNRISNVLTLTRGLLGVNGNVWDANPWLLGVANGVIDLRSGQLRDGRPDDYIRTIAPTTWRGLSAPAPRWERFISEVLSDEPDRVAFLQRLLGYALNGVTSEHVISICVGERGRNGKRVLFEAIQHVLGDYARSVSTDVLIGQEHKRTAGSAQPHLMELQGKRIAYCSETGEYDKLSAAQVKNITGGDPITARRLNENLVTFMPTHTLFLQTNRKPQAPADDDALWERVKVIEFKVRFIEHPTAADERPRDPQLEATLQTETSGILAWLVRGGLEWQRGGLQTPPSVRLARDTYRKGESIEPFLDDCCTEWDGGSAEGGALNEAYKTWCELRGLRPKSAVWLGKQLAQLFEKGRVTTAGPNAGRTVYHGVTLRDRSDWTVEDASDSSRTLQSLQYPSMPIETPKNANLETKIEGLGCPSDSMGENATREGVSLNIPSIPSIPSIQGLEQLLPPGYRVEQSGPRWQLRTPSGAVSWHSSRDQAVHRAIEAEAAMVVANSDDDDQVF